MWKCFSKTFIASLRKNLRTSSTVFTTKVSEHKNLACFLGCTPPIVLRRFNLNHGFYKKTCLNFSKGKKREETNNKSSSILENLNQIIYDFLKLGVVCVVGYVFTSYDRQSTSTLSQYRKTLQHLYGTTGVQPFNYILPEAQSAKTRKNRKANITQQQDAENSKSEEDENFISVENLEKAHHKVSGTLNNWMGTQYMESGDYKKAFKFFCRAASEENPAGIFNLGICHERGLGTRQNFEKAAEFYQKAANLGHASAMYNLGVFNVRGLGGIRPDKDHARELFREAAKLGQKEAMKALSLEQEILGDSPIADISVPKKVDNSFTQLISDKLFNSKSKRGLKNYGCDEKKKNDTNEFLFYLGEKSSDSSLNNDSGVLDLSPPC